MVRGQHLGRDVRLFDYQYTTGGGKHQSTHQFTVAAIVAGGPYPMLSIVPETWDKKLWDALGGDDIDFESDEFSRRFWVKSPERRFAYDIVHAPMMEFLLEPGWDSWELHGDLLVCWRRGRAAATELEGALARLHKFLNLLPRHLFAAVPGGRR